MRTEMGPSERDGDINKRKSMRGKAERRYLEDQVRTGRTNWSNNLA